MSFGDAIANYAEKTKLSIEDSVNAINIELTANIIAKTPADTGRLKSNWIPSFDSPSSEVTSSTDFKSNEARVKREASNSAGKVFYLTNNLPYAYRIEYEGWSAIKAPQGMLRISINEINSALMKFKTSK